MIQGSACVKDEDNRFGYDEASRVMNPNLFMPILELNRFGVWPVQAVGMSSSTVFEEEEEESALTNREQSGSRAKHSTTSVSNHDSYLPDHRMMIKRKDHGRKGKSSTKKARNSGRDRSESDGTGKLPYIHVRARRGQATDSHSLAERARREKINARMKLLQQLVPGCSEISGTASVLDEIINHVQYLQRQVASLSMKLAAVNPDDFFPAEGLQSVEDDLPHVFLWPDLYPDIYRSQQRSNADFNPAVHGP